MRTKTLSEIARRLELLGNPLRLRIYLAIVSQGCDCDIERQDGVTGNCISGLMQELNLPQSTVSTYIKDLSNAGLVECKKKGRVLYTRPSRQGLIQLKGFIDGILAQIRY